MCNEARRSGTHAAAVGNQGVGHTPHAGRRVFGWDVAGLTSEGTGREREGISENRADEGTRRIAGHGPARSGSFPRAAASSPPACGVKAGSGEIPPQESFRASRCFAEQNGTGCPRGVETL